MKPLQLGSLNADQCEQIYNEIAVALLDFRTEKFGDGALIPATRSFRS